MDYEICKKLKESGFPHSFQGFEVMELGEGYFADLPNLSELIEACGDKFGLLIRGKDGTFAATHATDHTFTPSYGKTPEEAVAKLWITLNKK